MGAQTMGSNGNGGTQHPKSDELAGQGQGQGQGPLYNLTLDEVQHQLGDLGKPLSCMNLDELLKSVWIAKANQGMSSGQLHLASASSMPQHSSLTLSKDLSKKTVDELWQDIQEGQKKKKKKKKNTSSSHNNNGSSNHHLDRKIGHEKQPTLGETTLEDFLVKVGIATKSSPGKKNPSSVLGVDSIALPQQNPQQAQWMNYQIPPIQQQQHVYVPGHHQLQQLISITAKPIMDAAYPETQMSMSPSPLMGTLSDAQMPGRKRVASGDVMEKTVERRQKRMIKNRESAARSRARKQAYTHELENKVSRLEEENERLKRQKEVEKILPCVLPPEPKYQLRRTTSAIF